MKIDKKVQKAFQKAGFHAKAKKMEFFRYKLSFFDESIPNVWEKELSIAKGMLSKKDRVIVLRKMVVDFLEEIEKII